MPRSTWVASGEILAVFLVFVLLIVPFPLASAITGSTSSRSASEPFASTAPTPVDTVSLSGQVATSLAPVFGADLRPEYRVGATLTSETQGTAISYFRFPGGAIADRFNMSTGTVYAPSSVAPTNESEFVAWCRSVACHAILQVPAEINDPAMAAWEVAYTEQKLGFYPDYWEIGNEPGLWTHFSFPWRAWSSTQTSTVSPAGYAVLVHQYITAMRAVDPHLQIIGLPGVGLGAYSEPVWLASTVALNGPNLSGVAIHVYPAGLGPTHPTLPQFFASLSGKASIPVRVALDNAAIQTACPSCAPIRIFVDELGSGSAGGGSWQAYMGGYPNVPYLAAELSQAVNSGVYSTEVCSFQGTYAGSLFDHAGTAHPIDQLYANLLPHLSPQGLATSVQGPVHGVYAIGSRDLNNSSVAVLIVNANATSSVALNLSGALLPASAAYSIWWWNSSTTGVQSSSGVGATSHWLLPPLGLLVLSVTRSSGAGGGRTQYSVTFHEAGLPAGTLWSVNITETIPNEFSSTTSSIGFAEPNGSYPYEIRGVSGYAPTPGSGTLVMVGSSANESIRFVPIPPVHGVAHSTVTFNETGLPYGTPWGLTIDNTTLSSLNTSIATVEPNGTYSYRLTPIPGWAPAQSLGGRFEVIGSSRSIAVSFVTGLPTTFTTDERSDTNNSSTSAPGSPGRLSIDNTTFPLGSGNLTLYLPAGSYAFNLSAPVGYAALASAGEVSVSNGPAEVVTEFVPLSSVFPTWFNETGLPRGTSWSVTISGFTVITKLASIILNVTDQEKYSFAIVGPLGYFAIPSSGPFTVLDHEVTLLVAFSRASTGGPGPLFPDGQILLGGLVAGVLLALTTIVRRRYR